MSEPLGRARRRAAAFLAAHGDSATVGGAAVLAGGELPAGFAAALEPQLEGADVEALCRALGILADSRALDTPAAERICVQLAGLQCEDGGWEPAAAEDGRLFVSGLMVGRLARTRFARTDVLDAAAAFLAAHWSPERVKGFAWEAIAAYAAAFSNFPHELSDEVLQWCGRELERGFRARQFDALRTARVLAWCDAPSLPGGRLEAVELLDGILTAQQPDGAWLDPVAADATARTEWTWHALAALTCLAPRGA